MHNMKLDIAFTFDMTCSMKPCIYQVRQELERFLTSITAHFSDMRIGIITHGDYDSKRYVTRYMNLTSDIEGIKDYIKKVEDSGINYWNEGEAYEEALFIAKSELSWRNDAKKILIVIGDDMPHTPIFPENKNNRDWRKELQGLQDLGVITYGVHAPTLARKRSEFFYSGLSEKSLDGNIIPLNQFIYIVDTLLAVIYKQDSDALLEKFEQTMVSENRYHRNMEIVINHLLGRTDGNKMGIRANTKSDDNTTALEEVSPTRFQILSVSEDTAIKEIVIESGADFKVGKGFYQLTKTENVSEKKEVLLQHITSGNFYTGAQARTLLGLSTGTKKITLSDVPKGYLAFIQSKSHNRSIKKGSNFLYEMES